jgi:regulator of RNase E activity RraA
MNNINFSDCKTKLYTAVISDIMDSMDMLNQVLEPGISPIDESKVLCGWARVGLYFPIYHDDETVNVYEHELKLVDSLKPDEVPVLICHGLKHIAPWGELLSTRATYLKAGGCITDGSVRDVRMIREMGFPVYAGNISPLDTKFRGKLMWCDVPGKIQGVNIISGDLIFGDVDGVVVVPGEHVESVLEKAFQKVSQENVVRQNLQKGQTLEQIFADHGIL